MSKRKTKVVKVNKKLIAKLDADAKMLFRRLPNSFSFETDLNSRSYEVRHRAANKLVEYFAYSPERQTVVTSPSVLSKAAEVLLEGPKLEHNEKVKGIFVGRLMAAWMLAHNSDDAGILEGRKLEENTFNEI